MIRPGFILATTVAYALVVFAMNRLSRWEFGPPLYDFYIAALLAVYVLSSAYVARRGGERWMFPTVLYVAGGSLLPAFIFAEAGWSAPRFRYLSCHHCFQYLDPAGGARTFLTMALVAVALGVAALPMGLLARRLFGTVDPDPHPALFPRRAR